VNFLSIELMSGRSGFRHFFSILFVLSICTNAFSNTGISSLFISPPQASPTLTFLAPSRPHIGDTVTISGTGFDATNIINNKVFFVTVWYVRPGVFEYDSIQAEIIAVTDTTLTAITPSGTTQGVISVSVSDQYATAVFDLYFAVIPTLTSFIPDNGYVGDTITIMGTGFNAWHPWTNRAWDAEAIGATSTSIRVIIPIGAGTGPVRVSNGGLSSQSMFNFVVLPAISFLDQTDGEVGTSLNIYGSGFDPTQASGYQLTFNGIPAVIDAVYPTFIQTKVPFHASSGPVQLTFNSQIVKGSGLQFFVIPTNVIVTTYTPDSGTIGTPVKISGSGFDQAGPPLVVTFGGNVVAKIDSSDQYSIYTKVPLGAQSASISVTAGGISANGRIFTIKEIILDMKPRIAKVGDTIVVTGSGFYKDAPYYYAIYFPDTYVRPTSVTDTTLCFVVPSSASSSFIPLIVSDYNLNVNFKLPKLNIIPVISSIEPDTVIAGRQMEIVIHGTGLRHSAQIGLFDVIFPNNVEKEIYHVDDSDVSFTTTVPGTVPSGTVPLSVRIDSLVSQSIDLVVLPDTFPYTPPPPRLDISDVTAVSFKCSWNKGYRELGYILDVSKDNFQTFLPGYKALILTDTSKMILGLEAGTSYEFRVRSYSDTDTTALSITSYARVMTVPPPPLALPAIDVSISGFTCRWHSTKGTRSYLIDVSDDFFVHSISDETIDTTALVKITGGNLLSTFQYRIRAANYSGISDYSNIITVAMITGIPDESAIKIVTLYPNPANNQLFISGLNKDALQETTMIDAMGKVTPVSLNYQGDKVFAYDIRALPNGLYILQMVVHQKVIQLRFIKQ
jgi:hypothetical protein